MFFIELLLWERNIENIKIASGFELLPHDPFTNMNHIEIPPLHTLKLFFKYCDYNMIIQTLPEKWDRVESLFLVKARTHNDVTRLWHFSLLCFAHRQNPLMHLMHIKTMLSVF